MPNSLVGYNNTDAAYEYKVIEPVVGGAGPDATQIRKAYWNETGGTLAANTLVTHSSGTAQGVGNSIQATDTTVGSSKIGVLTEDTLDDNWGTVVTKGPVTVLAQGAISAGDTVSVSGTTGGKVEKLTVTATAAGAIGHAIADAAAGVVLIELY